MKRLFAFLLVFVTAFSFCSCNKEDKQNLNSFYEKITESINLLNIIADDIYSNWYDAIYNDSFGDDIDIAIAFAQLAHSKDIETVKSLDSEIADLLKKLKGSKYEETTKNIMSVYNRYYELVINVSGSFKSFSADKEPLKKELAGLLKELSYEL